MNYLFLALSDFVDFITLILSFPPYITQSISNFLKAASGFNEDIENDEDKDTDNWGIGEK